MRQQQHAGSAESSVPCRDQFASLGIFQWRRGEQANAAGADRTQIIAEGSRQMQAQGDSAAMLRQQKQAAGDGCLGQLQLANVFLGNNHVATKRNVPVLLLKPALRTHHASIQGSRHRIHQATATQTSCLAAAKHFTVQPAVLAIHPMNGTGCGAHTKANVSRFKGRASRSGGAEDLSRGSDGNLSIRAKIQQCFGHVRSLAKVGGRDARKNVTANESANVGKHRDAIDNCNRPLEFRSGKRLAVQEWRSKGGCGQYIHGMPTKEMVHCRVAHQ